MGHVLMPSLGSYPSHAAMMEAYMREPPPPPPKAYSYEDLVPETPIDWSQPVQFSDGTPCQAERSMGFILITFDPTNMPLALEPILATKHFRDSLVAYEDTGAIYGWEDMPIRVENVGRAKHPLEDLVGIF